MAGSDRAREIEERWLDHHALIQVLALLALVGVAIEATVRPGPRRFRRGGRHGTDSVADGPPETSSRPPAGRGGSLERAVVTGDPAWSERLRVEQARHQRNGRPATILAIQLGRPVGALARRAARRRARLAEAAGQIAWAVRATDVVRAGADGIVRVLLPETDEDGGQACARRLAEIVPAIDIGVSAESWVIAAWAETKVGRDLWAANRLAAARLRGRSAGWLRSGAVHEQSGVPSPERM